TSVVVAPMPVFAPQWPMLPRPWPEGTTMLHNFDRGEMPRALQHMLTRDQAKDAAQLPRRAFLKLAGMGSLAIGAFPHLAMGQATTPDAAGLKPTQEPSAFVQIASNGDVTVTINRLEFGQGVQTGLPMILA